MNEAEQAEAGQEAAASPAGQEAAASPAGPGPWGRRRRQRPKRSTLLLAGLALLSGIVFATVFAFAVTRLGSRPQPAFRPTGIPATVSTSLADLMQLSPVPHAQAPGFTLTDQRGRAVSLSSFRGSTVVLTFMDSHCTDICPLVSREFIDAHRQLGADAGKVVFVAVNVNPYHRQVSDVAAFSREQGLDSIGKWYFLTGSMKSLRAVWSHYQIQVEVPSPSADVVHTSLVYFIGPSGTERYVIAPMVGHTKAGMAYLPPGRLADWSRGIALVARAVTP